MTWFRIDDKFHDHRKVRRLGRDRLAAVGLWTACGSWSADSLTDGQIPSEVVRRYDPKERLAARLVEVGLWHRGTVDDEPGYLFHQWDEHQPTRDEVLARRDKRAAAGRLGGLKSARARQQAKAEANAEPDAEADAKQNRTPTRPDPSFSGHLPAGGHLPARASAPPNPRCPKHATGPASGPCRACADARRTRETWNIEQAAAAETERRAIARCRLCDADGRRWDPSGKHRGTVGPCDHKPLPRQETA